MNGQQNHWENIYSTKQPNEVSWIQEVPKTSLDFVHNANLDKSANIIDIGGGDNKLVDHLLDEGFENISVIDISEQALNRAKQRLGDEATTVNWMASDITEFTPTTSYDFWHDRAAFHFLTTQPQIVKYLSTAGQAVKENGTVTIETFNDCGPKKCSGLEIKQYNEEQLTTELQNGFEKIKCITEGHTTPFETTQNFLFCSFRKRTESA